MIDREATEFPTHDQCLGVAADGAQTILSGVHPVVLLSGDPEHTA
jgi:hypothetical protein